MTEKTLRLLVGALVLAVALWGGVTLASGWGGHGTAAPPALAEFFKGATADSVTAARFQGPRDTLTLAHQEGPWTVDGLPADSGTVARFFATLTATKVGDLVSTNPANHASMGVDADSAWTVQLDVGSAKRTLLVGKSGPRYNTAYVRLPDHDQVYLAEGELRADVTRALDDWRNKRIVAVDTAAVHRIEVDRDGKSYALVRADSSWSLEGGEGVDKTAVSDILAELSDLRAAGFYQASDSTAEREAGGHVLALSASGDTLASVTLGSGDSDRWARAPGDSIIYRLAGWRVDRVAPKRDAVTGVKGK
jgi:Domain of unknown function (DUF4340)